MRSPCRSGLLWVAAHADDGAYVDEGAESNPTCGVGHVTTPGTHSEFLRDRIARCHGYGREADGLAAVALVILIGALLGGGAAAVPQADDAGSGHGRPTSGHGGGAPASGCQGRRRDQRGGGRGSACGTRRFATEARWVGGRRRPRPRRRRPRTRRDGGARRLCCAGAAGGCGGGDGQASSGLGGQAEGATTGPRSRDPPGRRLAGRKCGTKKRGGPSFLLMSCILAATCGRGRDHGQRHGSHVTIDYGWSPAEAPPPASTLATEASIGGTGHGHQAMNGGRTRDLATGGFAGGLRLVLLATT